jgi:hypothetical protein
MLRDHGPQDPGLLLSLFVLATWMNRGGYAYPSQESWARGARVSKRTVQRHQKLAVATGWLVIEDARRVGTHGWRQNAYRCAIPDALELDDQEEAISEAIGNEGGEIEPHEGDDTQMSSASLKPSDSIVSSRPNRGGDTMMSPRSPPERPHDRTTWRHGALNVTTWDDQRGDMGRHNVATSGCRTNSRKKLSLELTFKKARVTPRGRPGAR